jgi:nicotinate-nucleotide pyrophosphorylase (carboxylating)
MVSSRPELEEIVATALREDLGSSDVTTRYVVDADLMGEAVIVAKSDGILSGAKAAAQVFRITWPPCEYTATVPDGTRLHGGDIVAKIVGPLASILTGERTALNFLQRLSGVATASRRASEIVAGTGARVIDTRKTTPGMRVLEKYAVRVGGASNHRAGLDAGFLNKENHIRAAGGITRAVQAAQRRAAPGQIVEVEVTNLDELDEALAAGATLILLDNFSLEEMRAAVAQTRGRARLEASGGITLDNLSDVARTGVAFVSLGALTHSARALDFSLDFNS